MIVTKVSELDGAATEVAVVGFEVNGERCIRGLLKARRASGDVGVAATGELVWTEEARDGAAASVAGGGFAVNGEHSTWGLRAARRASGDVGAASVFVFADMLVLVVFIRALQRVTARGAAATGELLRAASRRWADDVGVMSVL